MYPTSAAYKTAITQSTREVKITGTITLKDSTAINITDEDIVLASLYFSEQCVSGEDIEIGNVYASELGLALTSPPLNPYSLDGARIIINFGINVEPDPEKDPLWEYVPLGYFYVTEIERKQTTVNLKALDGLILFDVDLSSVLTTGTPYALIQSCCAKAGVLLATDTGTFNTFANALTAFSLPADSKVETCRDLIMWVCQVTGTFARMNRLGQLEVIPVTAGSSVKTISKQERFSSDVSDFEVKVTQVNMKVGETEYSQGNDGMTLALEENPLMADKSEAEINAALAEILAQVTEAEYTPYNLTCAGDPALQAGDWVKLTGVSNINGPEFEYSRPSVAYHPDTGEEIPEDTPVFVDFAAGKKGSLMCEGTENLVPDAFDGPFLPLTYMGAGTQLSFLEGVGPGGCGVRRAVKSDSMTEHYVAAAQRIYGSFEEGQPVTFSVSVKAFGQSSVGGSFLLAIYDGSWHSGSILSLTEDFILCETTKVIASNRDNITVYVMASHIDVEVVGEGFEVCLPQIEAKPYPTPFQEGTRANPIKQITLSDDLPETFAIGIAAKMLHAHDTATRTFWECGGYRCYFDSTDNKLKITNGVVEAETAAVNWSEDDYVGIYAGRENGNLFIQAKIAGALTDRVEAEAGAGAGTGETLYVGSRADGSESVNAVVADMVFHDRPEDIDPEGYLSAIPGGGE